MLSGEYQNKHQYGPLPHVMRATTRYPTTHATHVKTQGTEAVAKLIRELANNLVEFIVGVDEGGAVFPIRGTAFHFGLLTFAETGREVAFARIDWRSSVQSHTPEVALFVAAYRAKVPPPEEELVESAPPAEAPVERADSAQSAQRYINLMLTTTAGAFRANDRLASVVTGPLDVDGFYWLLCNIGERIKESLVANALENPFPAEHLPPTALGWWLTVVVDGGRDINESDKYTFFLPVDGPSFVCSCTPGGLHHCGDRRLEFLYLMLETPAEPGLMRLRMMIYLESSLIQALEVSLPVGIQDEAPSGRIVWSRSESFSELELVARRSTSAFSEQHDGRHRFVFGMGNGVYAAFELSETQAGSLASSLRTRLYHAHFDTDEGRLVSRYDETLGPGRDRYLADLRTLAVQGAHAYQSLRRDLRVRRRTSGCSGAPPGRSSAGPGRGRGSRGDHGVAQDLAELLFHVLVVAVVSLDVQAREGGLVALVEDEQLAVGEHRVDEPAQHGGPS